ncbi:flagellar basal body-associated FliL family protein [Brevundimonas sp. Root1279]|uniref:flagellar basal body-associated FliL family protein n=1 Tax=Brevundimonas sp. Root1279 TaxID=1736443 RepID=UPI0006FD6E0B|nr:flagellar basal body-associated FliL family protein [Brevundimonas sp. Root1279]KQW78728.1 flagellar basal body protein FliL [Brevundimonas sp. Root1279]
MFKFLKKKGDDANLPAVSDGVEGEGGDAPAKKKLPLLFIAIPAALVVLGGGGGAAFFLMQPKAEAADAGGGHGAEKKGGDHGKSEKKKGGGHGGGGEEADPSLGVISEGPDGVVFYTLPDMVVNIQGPEGRPTYLKLKLTLEMKDHGLAEQLQGEMPRMQDMFQGFLRELRPDDLAGSAGSFQLRAEILRRVNLIAAPGKVDAVLIEEMLVQ